MASRGLGTLTLDLVAKIGGFEGPMDKAARTAQKRMSEIERSVSGGIKSVLKSFAAFGAGLLSIQAVFQGFSSAIDQADKLNDFTKRLGVSAEAISAWGYAASQTGTDIDSLGKGLKLLQKNMAEALDPKSTQSNLFKTLGIDVKDAKGNLKELEDILPEIADKFKTLDNDATETALSMQLFGKSGSDLREFLDLGSEGIDAFTEKARDLGIVLSQETLSAADDFNDAIGDLKTATQGAIYQALEPLLPVLQDLVVEMVNFAKSGDGAKKAGQEAAGGITAIGTAAKSVYGFLVGLREGLAAFEQQARGYTTLVLGGGASSMAQIEQSAKRLTAVFDGTFNAAKSGSAAVDPIDARLKTSFKSLDQQAKDIAEATKKRDALQEAVNKYLGNPTGRTEKAKKAEKSQAEKDAELLQKAYESLNERLREQVSLFGQDGEAARVRYEIENGELQKLTQAQKDELLARAEKLDVMRDEAKVAEDLRRIDEQRRESVEEILQDLAFETELLGKTAEEQERLNLLRYAGVDANSAYGQSILDAADQYQTLRKATEEQISIMDDFRQGASNALADFVTGAKSAKEAFTDFFDDMAARITQMIAEKWIEKLFGAQGSTGSGTGGGDWLGSLFGAFFGGGSGGSSAGSVADLYSGSWGFANGGTAPANSLFRINERGFETARVGNKDYMLTGSMPVRITPHEKVGGGGGFTQINQFKFASPTSERTQQQLAGQAGAQAAEARRRNGR